MTKTIDQYDGYLPHQPLATAPTPAPALDDLQRRALAILTDQHEQGTSYKLLGERTGTNKTSISDLLNGRYERVGHGVWSNIYRALHLEDMGQWRYFETANARRVEGWLEWARHDRHIVAIIGDKIGRAHV